MYKKLGIISLVITGICIVSGTPFYTGSVHQNYVAPRERKVQKKVLEEVVEFRNFVKDSFLTEVNKDIIDERKLELIFLKSRLLFKKFEWAATYFASDLSDRLNGPPIEEIENADLLDPTMARGVDPMGLQVIETFIYPHYNPARKNELASKVENLVLNTDYLVSYFTTHSLAGWRILDAAKLEIFRIIGLGITGYDNPSSLHSMEESATAMKSVREVVERYASGKDRNRLLQNMDAATAYLLDHPDFNRFDRADFIVHYANKVSSGIARLAQDLPGEKIMYNRMLRQDARTMFDTDAFNVDAFSPGPEFHITDAKVALGEKLFFDVSLSGTGTRSCASCHQPALAFTDGLAKNTTIHDRGKQLPENVPTLLNAALQSNYFYDMRALTLEDQAADVIANKQEMDGSMAEIIKYVSADSSYQSLFARAFPKNGGEKINRNEVLNALASYVRSLVRLNSRFDKYMRGNEEMLTPPELRGFNLFMGKAKCATCHFVPLFSGITPPKYIESETDVIGVPRSLTDSTLDPDPGYYGVIGVDTYQYAFKTPTLRNIGSTAPYMHNGVFRTLDQVMDFYNNGGGAGLGIDLPNQSLSREKLNLSDEEKKDIIAFMKSLDSE